MSSIIYIRSNGDDEELTAEQLELIHRFSDQARVWAYLLLKEAAGMSETEGGSTEKWLEVRQQWLAAKQELKALNPGYGDAVEKACQEQYGANLESQKTPLPPLPPDTDPKQGEQLKAAGEKVKKLFADLYPNRKMEVGFRGPFLTREEQNEILSYPDPEVAEQWQKLVGLDPAKLPGSMGAPADATLIDLARAVAHNKGVEKALPGGQSLEDFANDVVLRSIRSYNPYKAEDTHTGSPGYEGVKAAIATYLFRAMQNAVNTAFTSNAGRQRRNENPISLSQPIGSEESLTIEETLAEEGREEGWVKDLVEPFKAWLQERVNDRFTQKAADQLLQIYKEKFVDGESLSDIARHINQVSKRDRKKELAFLKKYNVDVSSFPATIQPYESVAADAAKRGQLIADFFAKLRAQVKELGKSPEAETAKEKLKAIEEDFAKISTPNAAYVSNRIRGDGPYKGQGPSIMEFLLQHPDIAEEYKKIQQKKKQSALEDFLTSISTLRKEGGLNYNLLRNKIEQKLSNENPQLFTVYTYLYESSFSNPDTARLMRLSPPRITGLKKKIVSTLLDLPEIQNFFQENENGSISPLRRFIYNEGDTVQVMSIKETGVITSILSDWYNIRLDNGNDVLTIKDDIQKYCTLVDSANNVLSHYYKRDVLSPQCYLSFVGGLKPQLVILELRPVDELKTAARLHINNSLVDITEITEKLPDNLLSILKGHIGASASLDTPFTSLFEEVE